MAQLRSARGAGALDTCTYANECDPGLVCLAAADVPGCEQDTRCCTPYCDLQAPVCELPGSTCVSLFDVLHVETPAQFALVGVCGDGT